MENQNNEIHLNASAVEFLRESAKWSKFLAIMGFIGIGLMVLAAIFMGAIMSMIPTGAESTEFNPMGAMKGFISVLYLALAALYFFPVYYLFKYANETKIALQTNDSDLLANGLGNLKSHHKFIGIMMIVVLSLYTLMFVGALVVGLFAASAV